jgi:hypothetical protein
MEAQRRSRDIQLYSLNSAVDGMGDQWRTPAALPPGNRPGTHYTRQRFPNYVQWDVNRFSVKKKERNQKNHSIFIKFEFSIFDHNLRYCSYKNFYNGWMMQDKVETYNSWPFSGYYHDSLPEGLSKNNRILVCWFTLIIINFTLCCKNAALSTANDKHTAYTMYKTHNHLRRRNWELSACKTRILIYCLAENPLKKKAVLYFEILGNINSAKIRRHIPQGRHPVINNVFLKINSPVL